MLIECPECYHQHTITTEQFQASDGAIECPDCSAQFDPLEHLTETSPEQQIDEESEEQLVTPYSWEKAQQPLSAAFWNYGVIAGVSLLVIQFFYFKSEALVQNQMVRPLLERTCLIIQCQLPLYDNIKEFSVLHSSFVASENHYTLQAAISNQAKFSQQYPNLKLTLQNFSGSAIAKRILQPKEYLKNLPATVLGKAETFTIKLDLALPDAQVGGFTIELI